MAKPKMKAFFMKFREKARDEEGNVIMQNGEPKYVMVNHIVRHNAGYIPKKS